MKTIIKIGALALCGILLWTLVSGIVDRAMEEASSSIGDLFSTEQSLDW